MEKVYKTYRIHGVLRHLLKFFMSTVWQSIRRHICGRLSLFLGGTSVASNHSEIIRLLLFIWAEFSVQLGEHGVYCDRRIGSNRLIVSCLTLRLRIVFRQLRLCCRYSVVSQIETIRCSDIVLISIISICSEWRF